MNGPEGSITYFCKRCKHKLESSSGAYVCEKCSNLICKLCFYGLSAHCIFCKTQIEKCLESLENVKYKQFFCSICFKEKYIKNGLFKCASCSFYALCLNCRSNLNNEKKVTNLVRNISIYEYQKMNDNNEWEEFKNGMNDVLFF